jgi:hypothetical protein
MVQVAHCCLRNAATKILSVYIGKVYYKKKEGKFKHKIPEEHHAHCSRASSRGM